MAKKNIIFGVILLIISNTAFGQNDTLRKKTFFAIKTDLVSLSYNLIMRSYGGALILEQGFLNRHSFQLTARYYKHNELNASRWTIIPEYKFFLSKKSDFKGFYSGINLRYENQVRLYPYDTNDGEKYLTGNFLGYGAGINFGFQTYIKQHLSIDFLLGLGGRYTTAHYDTPPGANFYIMKGSPTYPSPQLDGRFNINIGYKF